jgi:PAS domain S-box-containing protein
MPTSGILTDENAVSLYQLGEQLRNVEQRYEGLFEDAPVACHEIDQTGLVLRVNKAECELLGFDPQEMIGRPIWEFMSVDDGDRSQRAVRRKLSGEEPLSRVEREYKHRDGNILILDIHPTLIRDTQGFITGIRSFMIDITERKHAQRLLERQAAELSRSNSELEQFAYVASHDLQEPLRKIQAFGDRLRKRHGDALGEDGLDYLSRMQAASSRMQTLIQDLLSLSRVATSPREFTRVDLGDIVKGVLSDLESRIEALHGRVEVGPLPVVMGDRLQLSQLFQNLIGNGLKFHKPGEPPVVRIHAEYSGGWLASGGTCQLFVEDQGIGFDPKYSERIFQIFQRLHGRGEYEGSGIGLSICRKIVERHAGTISVQSEPGAGSKFVVTLPYGPFEGDHHHG